MKRAFEQQQYRGLAWIWVFVGIVEALVGLISMLQFGIIYSWSLQFPIGLACLMSGLSYLLFSLHKLLSKILGFLAILFFVIAISGVIWQLST
jgi:hypothetical protein